MTTDFREWQQLSQTKAFVERLKQSISTLEEQALFSIDDLSIEQIAISAIERKAEARIYTTIIEILTTEGGDDE